MRFMVSCWARKCELAQVKRRLDGFLEELTAPMGRAERRQWARAYVCGLLLDGERKSVEPIAARVLGALPHSPPVQALQQFVNQSPWPAAPVEEARAPLRGESGRSVKVLDHR